jgi:predicted nucleotidyltransferase
MDQIAQLCERYNLAELSVLGSALHDDFCLRSGIDFLVVFRDGDYGPWMAKLRCMEKDFAGLLVREVDLVPKEDGLRSENWIRRNHILSTARVIYGA